MNPYTLAAKVVAVIALGLFLRFNGRAAGVDAMRDKVASKDAALNAAAAALRGSASALREVNAEADRRIKSAEASARTASEAARVLDDAYGELLERQDKLARDLAEAKERKPGCADLLAMNLEAVCELPRR